MSEPKTDVAPPAGAVITVTVPSLTRLRSGIVHVSSGLVLRTTLGTTA
jgi:hypothetical protein